MPRRTRQPGDERATHLPWDKEGALPIPAGSPKPGRAARQAAGDPPARPTARARPPAREEYPGPQTASTGEHIEPGRVRPFRPRGR